MLIQVVGTGCTKCMKLAVLAEEAARKEGIDYSLEKITDIVKIVQMGILTTPALVIDGKLKCSGSVPSVERMTAYLKQ